GGSGALSFAMDVPLAGEIGALDRVVNGDVGAFVGVLHAAGIYPIARIVTFENDRLARAHPEWAVRDRTTGGLWVDDVGSGWVGPFRSEVWDYHAAIAREVAARGFDEVQFDYIRFPTSSRIADAVYARPDVEANRVAALTGFLARVREALAA